MEYYLAIKVGNLAIRNNTEGARGVLLSEISQTEKDRVLLYDLTYIWNLKKQKMNSQRADWWLQRQRLKGEMGAGDHTAQTSVIS